ncbi:hypothetical protein RI054_40g147230 [Pseudoscourfieldia marina]
MRDALVCRGTFEGAYSYFVFASSSDSRFFVVGEADFGGEDDEDDGDEDLGDGDGEGEGASSFAFTPTTPPSPQVTIKTKYSTQKKEIGMRRGAEHERADLRINEPPRSLSDDEVTPPPPPPPPPPAADTEHEQERDVIVTGGGGGVSVGVGVELLLERTTTSNIDAAAIRNMRMARSDQQLPLGSQIHTTQHYTRLSPSGLVRYHVLTPRRRSA